MYKLAVVSIGNRSCRRPTRDVLPPAAQLVVVCDDIDTAPAAALAPHRFDVVLTGGRPHHRMSTAGTSSTTSPRGGTAPGGSTTVERPSCRTTTCPAMPMAGVVPR